MHLLTRRTMSVGSILSKLWALVSRLIPSRENTTPRESSSSSSSLSRERRQIAHNLQYCNADDLYLIRNVLANVLRREGYKVFRTNVSIMHQAMFPRRPTNIGMGWSTSLGRITSTIDRWRWSSPYESMMLRVVKNKMYHPEVVSPKTWQIEPTTPP